jgi:MFS transporter
MTSHTGSDILPPSVQHRNLRFVVTDGIVVGLMSAGASFVSVWVIRLGASPLWVSLLSSLPSTIALAMTIPWSEFAGRQRHPQRVLAFARLAVHTVYPLIALVPFFLAGPWTARVIVIIWSLSAFPSSLSNMMFTLVMGHAVAPERRAFLMSRRWTFLGVAKLITLPIVSQLIDRLPFPRGYQLVYAINALLAGAAFYCVMQLRVQPSPEPPRPTKQEPWVDRIRRSMTEILRARSFLAFVGGRAMLNLGLAFVSALIPIYWVEHLEASDTWVGYFNAALSGATLLAYFLWVRVKRTYGTRWTLVPAVLGTALYPVMLTLARTPAAVLPIIAFNGLAGAGINLAFFDVLLENCPPNQEARFVAVSMTVVHLMGVIGAPLGAASLGFVTIRWGLSIGTLVALIGVAIFAFVRPSARRPARTAGS